jgi:hypothetical protein
MEPDIRVNGKIFKFDIVARIINTQIREGRGI